MSDATTHVKLSELVQALKKDGHTKGDMTSAIQSPFLRACFFQCLNHVDKFPPTGPAVRPSYVTLFFDLCPIFHENDYNQTVKARHAARYPNMVRNRVQTVVLERYRCAVLVGGG